MERQSFSIPRWPNPGPTGLAPYMLHPRVNNMVLGDYPQLQIVDIAVGQMFHRRGAAFAHIIEGNDIVIRSGGDSFTGLRAGFFGQLSLNDFVLRNLGSKPARIILVNRSHSQNWKPRFFSGGDLWYADRPAGIKLKSLWKATSLPQDFGYEDVVVGNPDGSPGLIPRHMHEGSAAVWYVYEGSGFAAVEIEGETHVEPVSAGSWGWFNPGQWHGLRGKLRFVSAQLPDIGTDYRFEKDVEFKYPPAEASK